MRRLASFSTKSPCVKGASAKSAASLRASGKLEWLLGIVLLAIVACIVVPILQQRPTAPEVDAGSEESVDKKRGLLVQVTDRITESLREGQQFSAQEGAVVEAHFSIGANVGSVRSDSTVDSTHTTTTSLHLELGSIGSSVSTPREDWKFLTFHGLDGEPADPSIVFFPDGSVQGGKLTLGWDGLHRLLRVDDSGRVESSFPEEPNRPVEQEVLVREEND